MEGLDWVRETEDHPLEGLDQVLETEDHPLEGLDQVLETVADHGLLPRTARYLTTAAVARDRNSLIVAGGC